MAKKKVSRKELLKGPDEFLTFSSRVAEFVSTHQQQLKYVGIAIVVMVISYLAVHAWIASVNEEGQTAYNAAAQSLLNVGMKLDLDPSELQKTGELFAEVIENQGMSKTARLALPQAAYVKFLEKDYSKAITLYRRFLDEVRGDTQYEFLTSLALAACYEAKGELKTAIETLTPLVETDSDTPFRESAMWRLARLYRLDNRPEKAEEILKEFVANYADSPLHAMAKANLESPPN
ncbi:MAG: tetratricopeptide repeat protein [Deltaproteobacteria bacterium]|nr:tetratricopeptide repeat protein [Deltaproteobacteria bacterium]